ncbi:hypothetical protein [Mesorhizobium sp.]|nr:hypothetical protein [Mesorhizobium sp.]
MLAFVEDLMENVTTVGLDLAKHLFQAHGAGLLRGGFSRETAP